MELKQKGSEANLGGIKQFMVTLKWTSAIDFDLSAMYLTKTGKVAMIYFGDEGDLNQFPFMQLSGDAGVGDTGGDNEEELRVVSISDMDKIWVIVWDYEAIQKGTPARFAESDLSITFMDDAGTNHKITLDNNNLANVSIIATIDNTSPLGAKLINSSKVGTLKGLKNTDQLLDIVNS